MARYCPLFSGSSGNSTCFLNPRGRGILIDVGVTTKRLVDALRQREIEPEHIDAVFITHEHIDHIRGLKVFLNRYPVPVYATAGTASALLGGDFLPEGVTPWVITGKVTAADLSVTPFATPHDSRESCGYLITFPDGRKAAVATDMGCLTETVKKALLGCDLVHMESNHDETMLERGPYSYQLKQRIKGNRGHLSNRVCAAFLPELLQSGTTRFTLSHLSRENNTPLLARDTALHALSACGAENGRDYTLTVASPEPTAPLEAF